MPLTATADAASSKREYYPIRPIDVVAVVAFWTALAFISAVGRELDPRIPGVPSRIVSAAVTAAYVEYALWALLTIPIWWLASRYSIEGGRRVGRVIFLLAVGFIVAMAMDSLLFHLRQSLMADPERLRRRPLPPLVGLGFLDDLMVYFAVLGAGIARDYFLRYRARVEEMIRLQAQLTQARLDVLRSQLNPHFLFNTLNSVSAMVERDPRGARRMIARLSDLLRYTLEESTEQEVPLHRELDLLEEYIDLMQIRFQGKLNVVVDAGEGTRDAFLPNLILQPIVENAIKHGVSQAEGPGEIRIRSRQDGRRLVITVEDNGPGSADGSSSLGVGLTNTNARLREMYGDSYAVTLRPRLPHGTEAEIVLPYHTSAVTDQGTPAT